MRIDRASRNIAAEPAQVYRALTTAEAVQVWLPPAGAKGMVEAFEPRPGGAFRMTLVFATSDGTARKSSSDSDIVTGRFIDLVPDKLVRQRFTFESDDPAFAGEMEMTWTLTRTLQGTDVGIAAENVPVGISPEEHRVGMASSLENLARYLA